MVPLAKADVNVPGVMATLVAPVVVQLSVLLEPEVMLVGFAEKESIVGLLVPFIVTVSVNVAEPAESVAVNVYVVVDVGLTLVEPVAKVDVNVPGVMAMLAAPVVAQLNVLLAPEFMLAGFAVKDAIAGTEPFPEDEFDEIPAAQPDRRAQTSTVNASAHNSNPEELSPRESGFFLENELEESILIRACE